MTLRFRASLAAYAVGVELIVWFVMVPVTIVRIATGRARRCELRERLFGAELRPGPRVLVHAVSAGEMVAAAPLVARLGPRAVVLSTQTAAGEATARLLQTACPHVERCVFLPWDRYSVRRWLRASGVSAVIVLETEIWPNLFAACHSLGIPLFVANGRVRNEDIPRYRLARPFFRHVLECATWIGVQNKTARDAFLAIGAPADRVEVGGNLKLDSTLPAQPLPPAVRASLSAAQVVVAASTHHPEEVLLLECVAGLRPRRRARLIIAPRDVRRAGEIERQAARRGLHAARLSGIVDGADVGAAEFDVLVIDQYGWLGAFYHSADVIFLGGTIAPIGGHNIVEAAATGRPVIVGPHVTDIATTVETLAQGGGIVRLAPHPTADTLREACEALLDDPGHASRIGSAGRRLCEQSAGAVDRYCAAVLHRIPAAGTVA